MLIKFLYIKPLILDQVRSYGIKKLKFLKTS